MPKGAFGDLSVVQVLCSAIDLTQLSHWSCSVEDPQNSILQ